MRRYTMRRSLVGVVALAALLVFTLPAAAVPRARTGERINVLLGTPTTFPANQPFHVAHGWILLPRDNENSPQTIGEYAFRLEVDGQTVEPDFVDRWVEPATTLRSQWVHNFPDGLSAGTHTFSGYFTGPCEGLVNAGYNPGPCPKQNEVLLAGGAPVTLTVQFTP
jgi:hypothetical protein